MVAYLFFVGRMTKPSLNMVTRTHAIQLMMGFYLTLLPSSALTKPWSTGNLQHPSTSSPIGESSHSGKKAGLTTQKSAHLQIWHGLNDLETISRILRLVCKSTLLSTSWIILVACWLGIARAVPRHLETSHQFQALQLQYLHIIQKQLFV